MNNNYTSTANIMIKYNHGQIKKRYKTRTYVADDEGRIFYDALLIKD